MRELRHLRMGVGCRKNGTVFTHDMTSLVRVGGARAAYIGLTRL